MFYDPMIAKLITWAPTREAAIDAQIAALDAFVIDGISDNVDFLSALMQHPRFRAGDLTTDFIAEEYPDGFHGAPADAQLIDDLAAIAGMVAVDHATSARREIDGQLGAADRTCRASASVRIDGARASRPDQAVQGRHAGGDRRRRADRHRRPLGAGAAAAVGRPSTAASASSRSRRAGRDWELQTRGASHKVQVLPPHVAELSQHMIEKVAARPVAAAAGADAGAADRLDVAVGDKVEPGQPVAVMEAMKMENILRAPKAATVKATPAKAGDSLAVDQVIVEFE